MHCVPLWMAENFLAKLLVARATVDPLSSVITFRCEPVEPLVPPKSIRLASGFSTSI